MYPQKRLEFTNFKTVKGFTNRAARTNFEKHLWWLCKHKQIWLAFLKRSSKIKKHKSSQKKQGTIRTHADLNMNSTILKF